jgi:membrane protein required for colicin V production
MLDVICVILILIALYKGMRRGFVVAVFSFLGIFIGLAAALKLSAVVASRLHQSTNIGERWLPFLAFFLVIAGVSLLIRFVSVMIEKSLRMVSLGLMNKLAGFLLYAVLYLLIYSVVLFYFTKMNLLKTETINASVCYHLIEPMGPSVVNAFGSFIPLFKDIFSQLENFFSSVAQKAGNA